MSMIRILASGAGLYPPVYTHPPEAEVRAVRSVLRSAIMDELDDLRGDVPGALSVLTRWRNVQHADESWPVGPTMTLAAPADAPYRLVARLERLQRAALAWESIHPAKADGDDPGLPDLETREAAAWALVGLASGNQAAVAGWMRRAIARCGMHAL